MSAAITTNDDIQVWRISSILSSCPSSSIIFSEKVYELARSLNATGEYVREIERRVQLKEATYRTSLEQVLENWVSSNPAAATLERLLSALTEINLMDAARSLRMTYPHDPLIPRRIFLPPKLGPKQGTFPGNGMQTQPSRYTLPSRPLYYVPRMLHTRNVISKKLFESQCSHVFAISGVPWHELSMLITHATTQTSSNAIEKRQLATNFVLLENDSHFEKVCTMTSKPVHILRMESQKIRWVKSSGNIGPLLHFIAAAEQDHWTEEELCRHVEVNGCKAVCIVDTPGNGKTTLLAEIGRKLTSSFPTRSIIFLSMSLLIAEIKNAVIADLKIAFRIAVETLTRNMSGASNTSLAHLFSPNGSTSELKVELLLDGADEVSWVDNVLLFKVLKIVNASFKSVRMWITSHPDLQQKLERTLNVLSYRIRPYSHEDQVRSLAAFWCKDHPHVVSIRARLNVYADKCLQYLNSGMNPNDKEITGIPLQCLLTAEIFEDQASDFAQASAVYVPIFSVKLNSIVDLYENFLRKKLAKYSKLPGRNSTDEERLWKVHMQLSVSLLFQDSKFPSVPQVSIEEVVRVGVLEGWDSKNPPKFLHRSFAEYFVARFIVSQLTRQGAWNDNHTNFLFLDTLAYHHSQGHFLWQFSSVIPYFINARLPDPSLIPSQTLEACRKELHTRKNFKELAHASAHSNAVRLFQFLLKLCEGINTDQLCSLLTSQFLKTLICRGNLELFSMMEPLYFFHRGFDLHIWMEILSVAIEAGESSIADYLLNVRGLGKHFNGALPFLTYDSFYFSLMDSSRDSDVVIKKKLQIINLLRNVDASIVKPDIKESTLLQENVHHRLHQEVGSIGGQIIYRGRMQ